MNNCSQLVSVITVCKNSESLIRNTILSVITQTYPNIEYIVIDGNSLDKTVDEINLFKDKISIFLSESDSGIYNAMNKAIGLANGEYCVFLNSGDTFYNNEVISDIFDKNIDYDFVFGDVAINKVGNIKFTNYPEKLSLYYLYSEIICHQCQFIRTDLLKKKHYDEKYRFSADYAFFIDAVYHGASYKKFNYVIANYLDDPNSHTTKNKNLCLLEIDKIHTRVFETNILELLREYHSFRISDLGRIALFLSKKEKFVNLIGKIKKIGRYINGAK
jgi:glycosyltransferase involved in cell wall biosynthesis